LEAAGIEPASEDIQQIASTCLSSSAISFWSVRRGRTQRNQARSASLARLGTNLGRYPASRRFSSTAGKN